MAVVAAAVGGTLFAVSGGSGGSSTTTVGQGPGSASAAPDPADVAAARACQAWNDYLSAALAGKVTPEVGQRLLSAAEALLPAKGSPASDEPLPKWAQLGSDLLSAATDVVNKNTASLATDGAAVAAQCKTIPPAAAEAGGFTGNATGASSP